MPAGIYKRRYKTLALYLAARSVARPSGCIIWTGQKTRGGYGTVNWRNTEINLRTTAHRAAYIETYDRIPDGMEIDHLCKNTLCINPLHLEAVTHYENVQRSSVAGKLNCKYGHAFTAENTGFKKNGTRRCKKCNARHQQELRKKHAPQPKGSRT